METELAHKHNMFNDPRVLNTMATEKKLGKDKFYETYTEEFKDLKAKAM